MSITRVWGKIPNVIEQRLLTALYQTRRPMSHADVLDLATKRGLINASMSLLALRDKGLVAEDRSSKYSLTPAATALTKVALEYNLFATPEELTNQPAPFIGRAEAARPPRTLAEELQRDLRSDLRSARTSAAAAAPQPPPTPAAPEPPVVVPMPSLRAAAVTAVAPVVLPTPAPASPAAAATPAVVEPPKPRVVAVSAPNSAAAKSAPKVPPLRRVPPPPPPRFRK